MPMGENEPLPGRPARAEPDEDSESSTAEPADDFFSSGSFSPVNVQLDDESDPAASEAAEGQGRSPDPDDSPRVLVQLGEDPGVVAREDPDDW